jgi:hypothetical protein
VSLTLNCHLEIFHAERERAMKLLQIGLTTSDGNRPYLCWGDSTVQRYIVHGIVCQVPDDFCPECWGEWDFEENHRAYPRCGAEKGKHVKILLDSDVCPNCEKGKVALAVRPARSADIRWT